LHIAGLCIGLNLFFYPGISYLFETAPQLAYSEASKAWLTAELAPAKALIGELNAKSPNEPVLFPAASPFGATLPARGKPAAAAANGAKTESEVVV